MTDMSLSQTMVFGHLWQSVAIAAALAAALIIGKRMRGATRYGLGVAAFLASLVLPLAVFIPGETIVAGLHRVLDPRPRFRNSRRRGPAGRSARCSGGACRSRHRRWRRTTAGDHGLRADGASSTARDSRGRGARPLHYAACDQHA